MSTKLVNLRMDFAFKQLFGIKENEEILTGFMQEGMPYRSLRKTITINLLDFILFSQDDAFHTIGQLWNTKMQRLLSDDIEIHFVEIPKLVIQWREGKVNPWENTFVRWMLLLPAHEDEHLTQTLEEIAMNQDPILQKAMDKWENMSHDSSFRTVYEAREKVLLDEQAKIAHAREEGLEEGIEKGIEQGKVQLIRGMHKNGMPLEDIARFTGLSTEKIRKILL
ncbi:ATPase [Bacillus thuringiensis serovar shandongiensis]|uniref:Rpn family recombination-promoting nuclease/putative transposase n=1 Tax=Bacillus cereus TaxID=1396 RepID=UPI0007501ACB|nr:Rpn family recombination-promoting nuclease/putative transposase [Bacillus cereus]OTX33660.1 Signal transduction histidine kinase [Bacillus thuringiensis serovar malayensis]OUB08524.1 ATPase [Bacillus thuringiensis serovar shandongiensis]